MTKTKKSLLNHQHETFRLREIEGSVNRSLSQVKVDIGNDSGIERRMPRFFPRALNGARRSFTRLRAY